RAGPLTTGTLHAGAAEPEAAFGSAAAFAGRDGDELPVDDRATLREGHTTVREDYAKQDGALLTAGTGAQNTHGYLCSTTARTGALGPWVPWRSRRLRSQIPRHSG